MQLRTAVIARLGYDPFSATASMAIIAEIARIGDTLLGKIVLLNDESSSQGVRELNAPHDRCSDLVRAMALSISIAIDPEAALARPGTVPTCWLEGEFGTSPCHSRVALMPRA